MNGKGDKRRPTDEKRFSDNYSKIFKAKQAYVPVRKLKREKIH